MGQYLAVGLRLKAAVKKSELQHEKLSVEEVLAKLEKQFNLSELYDRMEKEEYYVYALKKEVLDQELVPFVEEFYTLRYTGDDLKYAQQALDELKELPDTSERLELLKEKSYQAYQVGEDMDSFNPDVFPPIRARIYSSNAILSLDGKIIMECYGDLFDFFTRAIRAMMPQFELSKALTVWIDG